MTHKIVVGMTRGEAKKLEKLLHMKYKPSEIAGELGVSVYMVYRVYLPAGAPYERDKNKNIWIIGDVFADWARTHAEMNKHTGAKIPLETGQFYCLKCNKAVSPARVIKGSVNARGVINLSGKCPECSTKINRFGRASDWGGK